VTAGPLPRLLDRRGIARELGVTLTGAERVMRDCPLIHVGRRIYVERTEVDRWLQRQRRAASR
jgi:hypothetical protein